MISKNYDILFKEWKKEEEEPFSGWNFSYLSERQLSEEPPWSYENMARELMVKANSLLDLGTGGGEKLLEFKDVFPPRTVATEGYLPNLLLARERLELLGIEVVESQDSLFQKLPFGDEEFDLIILLEYRGFYVH